MDFICHVFHGKDLSLHVFIRQNIKWSSSRALLYSFIVFKYVILILRKDKYNLGRFGLYFWGIWGEAELFLGILGANANTFSETRK